MRRHAFILTGGIVTGLLASGVTVWQSTYAAFSSITVSAGNTFSVGSLALADNDGGATALMTAANLKPGDSGRGCIAVAYTGPSTPAAAIQLYAGAGASTNSLASNLYFSVEESTASTTSTTLPATSPTFLADDTSGGSCDVLAGLTPVYGGVSAATGGNPTSAKTLADFQAITTYAPGTSVATWTPAAQTGSNLEYRVFRFRYMLSPTAPLTVQNGTASLSITWEVRSS